MNITTDLRPVGTSAAQALRSAWLPFNGPATSLPRLYCLPHAGAGASAYRGWMRPLAGSVDVAPLQPPGRELRFREKPYLSVEAMVADLLDVLAADRPTRYALFGHSMGALVAFELARAIDRTTLPAPEQLIVSGRVAPERVLPGRPLYELSDDALAAELLSLDPASVMLRDRGLRAHFLPVIRADLVVNEAYRHRPGPRLAVPITALCGSDDARVPVADAAGWSDYTCWDFRLRVVSGGHFFPVDQQAVVLDILRETMAPVSS